MSGDAKLVFTPLDRMNMISLCTGGFFGGMTDGASKIEDAMRRAFCSIMAVFFVSVMTPGCRDSNIESTQDARHVNRPDVLVQRELES